MVLNADSLLKFIPRTDMQVNKDLSFKRYFKFIFVSVGRCIEQSNILSAGIVRSIKSSLDANLFSRYFWFSTECDRPSSGNCTYFRAMLLHCRSRRVVYKSQKPTNFAHNSIKFCLLLSQETKLPCQNAFKMHILALPFPG